MKFQGTGVANSLVGKVELVHRHEVIVNLGAAYPRMIPQLTWQTPIFHPNISNNGVVCLGGYGTHWVPSLTLSKMVLATTKDYSHRIYLSRGICAEVTLHFESGQWRPWPWTYPDYASGHYNEFFASLREHLKERMSAPNAGDKA